MITSLIIIAALVWATIAFGVVARRPLLVLLVWLVVGPVVSNVVRWPGGNPFFWAGQGDISRVNNYVTLESDVTFKEVLEPSRVLVLAIFGILVLERIVRKGRLPKLDRVEKLMALFAGLVLVNTVLLSNKPLFSVRLAVDVFAVPFLGYYLARRFTISDWEFGWMIKALAYLGLYVGAACMVERVVHTQTLYRLKGPFMQGALRGSSILHIVVVVIFFAVLSEALTARRNPDRPPAVKREIRWVLILGCPLIIALTWARGNWAGLILGIWVLLVLGRRLLGRRMRFAVTGLVFIVLPLAGLSVFALRSTVVVDERLGNVDNVLGRFETWKIVANEAAKHPVFGIGFNNSRDILAGITVTDPDADVGNYGTVHNSFLAFFAELGVTGLVAYLAMIGSLAGIGFKLYRYGRGPTERWRGVALVALIVAYLVPGFFASTIQMFGFGHLLFYAFAGALVGATWREDRLVEPAPEPVYSRRLAPGRADLSISSYRVSGR